MTTPELIDNLFEAIRAEIKKQIKGIDPLEYGRNIIEFEHAINGNSWHIRAEIDWDSFTADSFLFFTTFNEAGNEFTHPELKQIAKELQTKLDKQYSA